MVGKNQLNVNSLDFFRCKMPYVNSIITINVVRPQNENKIPCNCGRLSFLYYEFDLRSTQIKK